MKVRVLLEAQNVKYMDIVLYWLGSVIISLLMVLVGAVYAGIKLGFNNRISGRAGLWTMLSIMFMLIPIVNIITSVITAYIYVKEVK